jgi:hypothetical protein
MPDPSHLHTLFAAEKNTPSEKKEKNERKMENRKTPQPNLETLCRTYEKVLTTWRGANDT